MLAFTPPTGPVQGGTLLTLTGAKLDGGLLYTTLRGFELNDWSDDELCSPPERLARLSGPASPFA